MKPNEALQILIKHQSWRKGEHDNATEPKDLTEAMNVAIEALESVSKTENGEVKSAEQFAIDYYQVRKSKVQLVSLTSAIRFAERYHEYHNQFQLNANNE
jgi:hypothetical protein